MPHTYRSLIIHAMFSTQDRRPLLTATIKEARNYILNQEAHHRKLTYEEEVAALLKRHGVKFERGDLQ